jgi:hypothetical protein
MLEETDWIKQLSSPEKIEDLSDSPVSDIKAGHQEIELEACPIEQSREYTLPPDDLVISATAEETKQLSSTKKPLTSLIESKMSEEKEKDASENILRSSPSFEDQPSEEDPDLPKQCIKESPGDQETKS